MPFMYVVHVTLVQIIGVPFVLNRGMSAIGTMGMVAVDMCFVITHWCVLPSWPVPASALPGVLIT